MKPVSVSACVPAPKTGSSSIDAHRTPSQKARGYLFRTNKGPHVSRQIQPPLNCLPPFQSSIWFLQCLYTLCCFINNVKIKGSVLKRIRKYCSNLDNIIKTIDLNLFYCDQIKILENCNHILSDVTMYRNEFNIMCKGSLSDTLLMDWRAGSVEE